MVHIILAIAFPVYQFPFKDNSSSYCFLIYYFSDIKKYFCNIQLSQAVHLGPGLCIQIPTVHKNNTSFGN